MVDFVKAESDERVANNIMRHEYRVLSEEEKMQMRDIKDLGAAFVLRLHQIGRTSPEKDGERMGSANLTLAMRHMEDAVYRAVKHITG